MRVLEMLNQYDNVEAFVDHEVDPDEIKRLQFKSNDDRSVHAYAIALIFGSSPETKLGLSLLQDELGDRTKDSDKAELFLLLAIGNLRLKEHGNALRFAVALNELDNVEYEEVSKELLEVIDDRIAKESVKNIAIITAIGGVVMAGLFALTSYFLPKKRRGRLL